MADGDSEMRFIDVPERTEENLVITVSREERSQNDSQSWADRGENAESHMHHIFIQISTPLMGFFLQAD